MAEEEDHERQGEVEEEEQEQEDIEGKEEGQGQIKRLPNPGSRLARSMGCICAVLDNNHGYYPPYPPDGWWITGGCPVHGPLASKEDGDDSR